MIRRTFFITEFVDIDECLVSNGGCEFNCTNLEGINIATGLGYQCGCQAGYQLATNNHTCIGMYIHMYVCTYEWFVIIRTNELCTCVRSYTIKIYNCNVFLSLSTVVLNGRDCQGKLWLPK